jgi:hypothetical protein
MSTRERLLRATPSFRTSEPWLVHNPFILLAVSALDQAIGN